jgi:putative oxidoreductase
MLILQRVYTHFILFCLSPATLLCAIKHTVMKAFLKSLPAALLLCLLLYAATSKLLNFSLFRVSLYRQTFPHSVATLLSYAIPASELCAVILLLIRKTFFAGLLLSLTLLTLFTGYAGLILLHWWARVPCPCGGILYHLSWTAHLVFNSCFLLLNLIALHIYLKERRSVT